MDSKISRNYRKETKAFWALRGTWRNTIVIVQNVYREKLHVAYNNIMARKLCFRAVFCSDLCIITNTFYKGDK